MRRHLLLLVALVFTGSIFAQQKQSVQVNPVKKSKQSDEWHLQPQAEGTPDHRTCGSDDIRDHYMENDPEFKNLQLQFEEYNKYMAAHPELLRENGTQAVITIPVVVHVVYRTSTQNISLSQIQSQITALNEDYRRLNADTTNTPSAFKPLGADVEIEFCLAQQDPNGQAHSGINRIQTSTSQIGSSNSVKYTSQGGQDAWPRDKYLNMWVCDIGGGILGYATPPGGSASLDGVVIDYRYFGTTGTASFPFNKGRTATHEVGHWFNLLHTWGNSGGCSDDDLVTDTPNSSQPNYGCATGNVSCSSVDMVENYMDYSDDACMNIFTTGQKTRMLNAINFYRNAIKTSPGCQNPGGGGTTQTCDTIGFPLAGTPTLYGSDQWGYVSGHNNYGDISKANKVTGYSPYDQVTGITYWFGAASSSGSTAKITAKIWDDNGTGGVPGTVLYQQDILLDDIVTDIGNNAYTIINLPTPLTVSGDFYVGFSFTYAPGDTVGVVTNQDGDSGPGIGWEEWGSGGGWYAYSDASSWQISIMNAIFPHMCNSQATGIAETDFANEVSIWPNPTNGNLNISSNGAWTGDVNIRLTNTLGQVVMTEDADIKANFDYELNLENLPAGIYYMTLTKDGQRVIEKVVKQ